MTPSTSARIVALTATLALTACASQPDPSTFGGRLALEGGTVAAIGEDWSRGKEQVEDGRALIEKGKKRIDNGESQAEKARKAISRGQNEVEKGRDMVADGERAMTLAEQAYQRSQPAGTAPALAQ